MLVHLLLNTRASSVTPDAVEAVRDALAARHEVALAPTRAPRHAAELAADARAAGAGCVAVLGGDGTMNEAAGALVGGDCAVAPLPGGSTSVLSRSLGYPGDPAAAAAAVAAALEAGHVDRIGVGLAEPAGGEGRHFVCHVGIGWDAALVAEVERYRRRLHRANHALFVAAGLRTFFAGYDRAEPHFTVSFPGRAHPHSVEGAFSLVLNSDPYTFVGSRPFVVAPAADRHRPFAVATVRDMAALPFLRTMAGALRGKGLRPSANLDTREDVSEVVFTRRTTMPYQLDGDLIGDVAELRVRHLPDALPVVVPDADDLSDPGRPGPPLARW
ncbi:MAG: diacylglycerol/lipid kinase family protein [Microthrixaceae bacterium]